MACAQTRCSPEFAGDHAWVRGIGSGPSGIAIAEPVLAIGVAIYAILWRRDSVSVIGRVGLVWLAPSGLIPSWMSCTAANG